jgi:hypothetical protein
MEWGANTTIGEKYHPAMAITTQAEASAYFERLVQHTMKYRPCERAEAERIERGNLGYFAGYYDHETRLRFESLFSCAHPIFGAAAVNEPSPVEAFTAGLTMGSS